jgi:hypothetical protein
MRSGIPIALLLAGCAASPTAPPDGLVAAVEANARLVFAHYDADHDGKLSAAEAQHVAISGSAFAALDADHDGGLGWAEFATPGRLRGLAGTFQAVATSLVKDEDQDGDGRLSRQEYRTGLMVPLPGPLVASPLPDPLESSFAHADLDGDGYLTSAEASGLIGFLLACGYHLQQRVQL